MPTIYGVVSALPACWLGRCAPPSQATAHNTMAHHSLRVRRSSISLELSPQRKPLNVCVFARCDSSQSHSTTQGQTAQVAVAPPSPHSAVRNVAKALSHSQSEVDCLFHIDELCRYVWAVLLQLEASADFWCTCHISTTNRLAARHPQEATRSLDAVREAGTAAAASLGLVVWESAAEARFTALLGQLRGTAAVAASSAGADSAPQSCGVSRTVHRQVVLPSGALRARGTPSSVDGAGGGAVGGGGDFGGIIDCVGSSFVAVVEQGREGGDEEGGECCSTDGAATELRCESGTFERTLSWDVGSERSLDAVPLAGAVDVSGPELLPMASGGEVVVKMWPHGHGHARLVTFSSRMSTFVE